MLIGPSRIQSRARGCRSFSLHGIVGWLVGHAIVNSRELLKGDRIL